MMSLSTKGRYAARIMVYLAGQEDNWPVTKYQIGEEEGISANYVVQIMILLKAAHLVRSHRGPRGGYSLARSAETITLGDVVEAVEGPVCPVPCICDSCERERFCPVRPVWRKAAAAFEQVLSVDTIAELAEKSSESDAEVAYQI